MSDNEYYHESPRKIFSDSPSRIPRSRGSSTEHLRTTYPSSVKDFLRSHDRKLRGSVLAEERILARANLDPTSWNQILAVFSMIDRVVGYSEAQGEMLGSWRAALAYEPETSEVMLVVESIFEENDNIYVTVTELLTEIKRLTRIACSKEKFPHGIITGMEALISDFNQSAVALDMLIERGIENLTSEEAPVFQAFHRYWKSKASYYQVATGSYTPSPENAWELIHTKLQTVMQDISAILTVLEGMPRMQKHSKSYFQRRLNEFTILLQRAEAKLPPLALR